MTLSLTLGMSIGVRKTFWMMWGELAGVALVSIFAVAGVATVMLRHPTLFITLKYIGGAYLLFLGIQLFRSRGKMAISKICIPGTKSAQKHLPVKGLSPQSPIPRAGPL